MGEWIHFNRHKHVLFIKQLEICVLHSKCHSSFGKIYSCQDYKSGKRLPDMLCFMLYLYYIALRLFFLVFFLSLPHLLQAQWWGSWFTQARSCAVSWTPPTLGTRYSSVSQSWKTEVWSFNCMKVFFLVCVFLYSICVIGFNLIIQIN